MKLHHDVGGRVFHNQFHNNLVFLTTYLFCDFLYAALASHQLIIVNRLFEIIRPSLHRKGENQDTSRTPGRSAQSV